jgi:hypothetical protein
MISSVPATAAPSSPCLIGLHGIMDSPDACAPSPALTGREPLRDPEWSLMASLAETNPYLRDPEMRRFLLEDNAFASSVFEGARGLTRPQQRPSARKRRSIASRKKSDKSA